MELLAGLGVVDQDLRGLELRTLGVSPAVHVVHELLRAGEVQHAEGAAQERRVADAEHRTNVTCRCRAEGNIQSIVTDESNEK